MSLAVLQKKLTITEIFYSIQGESYLSGLPFVFVRLTGCHQRCVYCDTEYAFYGGQKMTLLQILEQVKSYKCFHVLITGGEPLLQHNTPMLAQILLDSGFKVSIETSGARDISILPSDVVKIMDIKTPSSGEESKNCYANIDHLKTQDEVKFVIHAPEDIDWSLKQIIKFELHKLCVVSFSCTKPELRESVALAILASGVSIRFQVQLHKLIWAESQGK